MRRIVVAVVAGLCYSLVGCGSGETTQVSDEAGASASADAEASASAEAEAEASASAEANADAAAAAVEAREAEELAAAEASRQECESQMGELLEALKQIDGRLDVGLTNADLGTRLGDVSVTYNDIPFRQLSPECVKGVGIPLENAYNEYAESKTKWDACLEDYPCTVEGAKLTELQGHWSKASRLVGQVKRALASPEKFMAT